MSEDKQQRSTAQILDLPKFKFNFHGTRDVWRRHPWLKQAVPVGYAKKMGVSYESLLYYICLLYDKYGLLQQYKKYSRAKERALKLSKIDKEVAKKYRIELTHLGCSFFRYNNDEKWGLYLSLKASIEESQEFLMSDTQELDADTVRFIQEMDMAQESKDTLIEALTMSDDKRAGMIAKKQAIGDKMPESLDKLIAVENIIFPEDAEFREEIKKNEKDIEKGIVENNAWTKEEFFQPREYEIRKRQKNDDADDQESVLDEE